MPTITENHAFWNDTQHWVAQGEEWSAMWGSSANQWQQSLLPRLAAWLPAASILEIAPGFGRWTHYLKTMCDQLTVVDLSPECIEICKQRFAGDDHISYYTNDGTSLDMIPDGSIDFVFSFDSLVHAEAGVLAAYLPQIARKLTPDGVAFVHHSNLGMYHRYARLVQRFPLLRRASIKLRLMPTDHWRAPSMTATLFQQYASQAGLQCISQELINWGYTRLTDCFSIVTRPESRWSRPLIQHHNPHFMNEAQYVAQLPHLARLYGQITVVNQAQGHPNTRAV